jgi:molecular chaperone HtpG
MLFIPEDRPFDLFQPEANKGPRLYARRVLIDEHAGELLPDWLRFVRGVVDSEDIQLNVSREMVQKTPIVRKIRDQLTKRILKELKKLAKKDEDKFATIWKAFGLLLKEGYYHDNSAYGASLLPLLRFHTTTSEDEDGLRSLAQLKEAMPEGQDALWYLTAETRDAALASPHLEAFKSKGWEVVLLTDPVDEWLVQSLTEFEEIPLKSVSRGELEIEEDEEDEKEKVDLKAFTPWVADVLDGLVSEVRPSNRLTDSACVLVDGEDGMSANMERILRGANQDIGKNERALELNPKHPLIRNLAALHEAGQTDAAEPIVRLLYDDALLLEGSVRDSAGMGRRLQDILVVASGAALRPS